MLPFIVKYYFLPRSLTFSSLVQLFYMEPGAGWGSGGGPFLRPQEFSFGNRLAIVLFTKMVRFFLSSDKAAFPGVRQKQLRFRPTLIYGAKGTILRQHDGGRRNGGMMRMMELMIVMWLLLMMM
jgi:hypothetical protein